MIFNRFVYVNNCILYYFVNRTITILHGHWLSHLLSSVHTVVRCCYPVLETAKNRKHYEHNPKLYL